MWDSISPPWQATMKLVWEAYCDDCLPIAAVITDAEGTILARGRNRIRGKRTSPQGFRSGNRLAHAEVEALNNLDYDSVDRHTCILYTATEPCPMCLSAIYWARLDRLYFANSRDDAKAIGFDDAHIYEEVGKPVHERVIPTVHMHLPEAAAVFAEWHDKADKVEY